MLWYLQEWRLKLASRRNLKLTTLGGVFTCSLFGTSLPREDIWINSIHSVWMTGYVSPMDQFYPCEMDRRA
jgi:hypothetical protein